MNTWIEGPSAQEKRGMGCVGKGCLILACFIVFLIIAGAIGLYFGMRTHSAVLHSVVWAKKAHVLSQEPSPVPQFETTDENMSAARQKWKDFENTRNQPANRHLAGRIRFPISAASSRGPRGAVGGKRCGRTGIGHRA